ncbi:MAG: efflux RND transporter periplasmic adaptor subunit [Candidatus Moranbacteria bacterium]|nr:efflux RND transporter periplasmic adaptor subunit [Candidatus Moranbacteria bacterium]
MAKKKTIIWSIIGLVLVSGVVYFAFFQKAKVQYNMATAKKGDLSKTVSVTGTLKANDTVGLNFESTGRVRDVQVKVGQTVAKGDIVAVLNDDNLQLQVDQAKSNLDKARAQAGVSDDSIHTAEVAKENAENALGGTKNLNDANVAAADQVKKDAETKYDHAQDYYDQVKSDSGEGSAEAKLAKLTLDAAEAAYNSAKKAQDVANEQADLARTQAENTLETAKANLAAAKSKYIAASNDASVAGFEAAYETALNDLDKATLRAPADGTIKEVNFKVGEVYSGSYNASSSSTDFAKMISFGKVLETKVPESDIAKIKLDQTASVSFDAFPADEKFNAMVVSVEPSATVVQDVVDYVAKLTMQTDDPRFKDGMSADVDILIEKKENVISVPQRAVQEKDGKDIVQILKDGQPEDRQVQLGFQGDEGMVEVISGLSESDEVITSTK